MLGIPAQQKGMEAAVLERNFFDVALKIDGPTRLVCSFDLFHACATDIMGNFYVSFACPDEMKVYGSLWSLDIKRLVVEVAGYSVACDGWGRAGEGTYSGG